MKKILPLIFLSILLSACQNAPAIQVPNSLSINNTPTMTPTTTPSTSPTATPQGQKVFATIKTTKGDIKLELFSDMAPKTVANFVGLANGSKEWTSPTTGKKLQNTPLYNNTVFHRIMKGFMIQGGDPMGTGMGGPGYRFDDEPVTEKYTRGTIAMANSGPNTNGSQFFIMHADYALPPAYTIFGRIPADDTASFTTLDAIANTPVESDGRGETSKPSEKVSIKSIEISSK